MDESSDGGLPFNASPGVRSETADEKAALRAALVGRVRELPEGERADRAERAAASLASFLKREGAPGSVVALYAATKTELASGPAVRRLRERFRLAFPRVKGSSLTFHLADYESLAARQSWVREPAESDPAVIPDVVVLPGRAFDRQGIRLGHGWGYYDRALAEIPAKTLLVGFCYSFQVLERLPREPHDRWVHWLITDSEVPYRCHTEADLPAVPSPSRLVERR